MFNQIIVPVDGSAFGELALPWALGIAEKSGAGVRLVTVITPLPISTPPENLGTTEEGSLILAREHAEEYQSELRRRMTDSGFQAPVSTYVEIGSVVPRLDLHAREAGADLMVMTTHGRGPLRRAWLGSVADGLLRRTPCPILAVRPGEGDQPDLAPRVIQNLLVTLDGSPEAREILPFAKRLARLSEARITLLRVIPYHYPLSSPFTSHTAHDFQGVEAEEAAARESLVSEVEALRAEGLEAELAVLTGIHPADGILEFAAEAGVDLVAMATHGRGGVARLVLGSVADKVVRGGNFPVLLHRAQAGPS